MHEKSEKESRDEAVQRHGGAVPETMWKQMKAILY